MKKLIQSFLFIFALNVFAHESGELIKADCFISNVNVISLQQGFPIVKELCYKDNHPEGFDEKKAASECLAYVSIDFILGSHDLSELSGKGAWASYDMKTEISFKDGKKFTNIVIINETIRSVDLLIVGQEKMLRFYNREDPTDVQCTIY